MSMRLLTDRLAWLDGQARQLAAENDSLRRELDKVGRLVEVDARSRADEMAVAAENRAAARDAQRLREFDQRREALAARLSDLEGRARTRIKEIRASSDQLEETARAAAIVKLEAESDLGGDIDELEDVMAEGVVAQLTPEPDLDEERLAARREEAESLDREIQALLRLRGTIVSSVREMLIGLAEELAYTEREQLATLPPPEGEPEDLPAP